MAADRPGGTPQAKPAAFVYTPSLATASLRPDHPLKLSRARTCYDLLSGTGVFDAGAARIVAPAPADEADVLRVHDPAYVDVVRRLSDPSTASSVSSTETARRGLAPLGDTPPFAGMYKYHLLVSGAALEAARLVDQGEAPIAFSPAGGVNHHAHRDAASGFGIFNDAAVAIAWLREMGRRVMYVDLDVHHGNGVEEAFCEDDGVLTVSLHESTRFLFPGPSGGFPESIGQGRGRGYSVNVALDPHTDDEIWIWAFEEIVPPLYRAYRPDLLLAQLGADAYFSDPLAHLLLTTRAYEHAAACLAEITDRRLVAVGGGGYDVDAAPRVWALEFLTFIGWENRQQLRDRPESAPHLLPELRDRVRRAAESAVDSVKELVFPIVGATAN